MIGILAFVLFYGFVPIAACILAHFLIRRSYSEEGQR